MESYLNKLHKKPDYQKKQFAFLASSTITLFIFGIWSLATFGISEGTIAKTDDTPIVSSEVSPFQSFRSNVALSLDAIKSNLQEVKRSFETINLDTEYKEMRNGALNTYGQ